MDKLLTLEEAADVLRVPVGTLYKWRAARTGPPSFRIGKYVRYREADLQKWIDSRPGGTRVA